jgi:hypothetical protein
MCVLAYSCFNKNPLTRSWLTSHLSSWGCYNHIPCTPSLKRARKPPSHLLVPRGNFPAIQFPLPGKELLLQLDNHHRCSHCTRKRSPNPNSCQGSVLPQMTGPGKRRHRIRTHQTNGEAWPEEHPSSLGGMGVGHHHGRGSHDKDVSHDLPDWPLWVVEQDEPQDQQRGRKFLFRLAED